MHLDRAGRQGRRRIRGPPDLIQHSPRALAGLPARRPVGVSLTQWSDGIVQPAIAGWSLVRARRRCHADLRRALAGDGDGGS
jgi:hypothetical protein